MAGKMLIIQGTVVINLATCDSFACGDCPHDEYKYQISFSHRESTDLLIFKKKENRDKAFQDILFAYAEGKQVFAIINPIEEQ